MTDVPHSCSLRYMTNTLTPTTCRITLHLDDIIPSAVCDCGAGASDPDKDALGTWVHEHLHPGDAPRYPYPCHPICYDNDGHTDGCLYDDGLS